MKRRTITLIVLLAILSACAAPATPAPALPNLTPDVDPTSWQRIPAGDYLEGQFAHAATLPYDYEIMVTPATNAQVADYLNAALAAGEINLTIDTIIGAYPGDVYRGGKHEEEIAAGDWVLLPLKDPASRLTFDGTAFSVIAGYERHPMTMVSWFGAWSYCQAQGGRLPLDSEWEKAARGTDSRPYPWGDGIAGARANFNDSGDPFEETSGTTPVGFYNGATYAGYLTERGDSPYGVHDMAGNVWEWTGDVHPGTHNRSLRGGSHASYGYDLRIWSHNNAHPLHVSPSVGFRCVRDSHARDSHAAP